MDSGIDYWESLKYAGKEQPLDIPSNRVGISSGLGDIDVALKKNIFFGVSHLELGFMHGLGAKGSRLSNAMGVPESFGKEERESFRQLAKINEVDLSIHTSPNAVSSVSGMGRGGFTKEQKEQVYNDVRMTVDFAADVARGGPVVVHIGEAPRPLHGIEGGKFKLHETEQEEKKYLVVDQRTGNIVTEGIGDKTVFYEPVAKIDPKTGKPEEIVNPVTGTRITVYEEEDSVKHTLRVQPITFKDFKTNPDNASKYHFNIGEEETAALAFVKAQLENQKRNVAGSAEEYERFYHVFTENIKAAKDRYEYLDKIVKAPRPESEKWKIADYQREYDKLREEMIEFEKRAKYGYENAAYAQGQVKKIEQQIDDLRTVTDYSRGEAADNLARMAVYAYRKEKNMGLEKPLFIAPENYQPEMYGGHPQEYKKLILDARSQMVERLSKEGIDRDEAKKIAKDHIKGTFDTGHANMWRKYFQDKDPDGKNFDKWLVDQVGDLAKEGVIGHIHLTDNFGYGDEHISIGEGNTPTQDIIKKLKEKGYEGKFIAEPGNQPQGQIHKVWTTALDMADTPIYSIDRTPVRWTSIEGSYFGRTYSPTYIVGDTRPSEEWTLWSGVQLE